jgi:hypothetical protein
MRDLLLLAARNDVVRREVVVAVHAEASPFLLLDLLGDLRRGFSRSRMCPKLASTRYFVPRNRPSVFAFAGDSTITSV